MAAPVTGPFRTFASGTLGNYQSYFAKTGYKQAKPRTIVLEYDARGCKLDRMIPATGNNYDAAGLAAAQNIISEVNAWRSSALLRNSLYDKFKDHVSDRADMGVGLAELRKSTTMITERALQLAQFCSALRRGQFDRAARILTLDKPPKGVSRQKQAASNYLEFHFGAAPLYGDIHNAIDVLQRPLKSIAVRATKAEILGRWDLEPPVHLVQTRVAYPNDLERITHRYWDIRQRRVACGAHVVVNNHNLWLANQLGLINPASIAWELVPFSFVSDWFGNIGTIIGSYSDFYGLTLSEEWTTTVIHGYASRYYWRKYQVWNGSDWVVTETTQQQCSGAFYHIRRQVGLPKPTFALRPFSAGIRKAAAAVSLLILQLERLRH